MPNYSRLLFVLIGCIDNALGPKICKAHFRGATFQTTVSSKSSKKEPISRRHVVPSVTHPNTTLLASLYTRGL